MFSSLKKKIESEVGDLSRLTPNLRSLASQSDKLTPLSSRQNSVGSLVGENTNKQGPVSPGGIIVQQDGQQSSSSLWSPNQPTTGKQESTSFPQKLKRQFEEKMQSLELDFAWRLSSKDEEILKLKKQVEHLSTELENKDSATTLKLTRLHDDLDSLSGFSQQENAKIKHLLLNKEEELSNLKATILNRDSSLSEAENQLKSTSSENERLRKSVDELTSRLKHDEEKVTLKREVERLGEELGVEKMEKSTLYNEVKNLMGRLSIFEKEIREKDKIVEELSKDDKQLEERIAALEQEKSTLESQLLERQKDRDESISNLTQDLKQKTELVKELERTNALISEEFEKAKSLMSEKESKLENSLKEKDQIIQEMKHLTSSGSSENAIIEKDEVINELKSRLDGKNNLEEKVIILERELREMVSEKASLSQELKKNGEKLKENEAELSKLQNSIKEKEATILESTNSLQQKDHLLKTTQSDLNERTNVILSMENQISNLTQQLTDKLQKKEAKMASILQENESLRVEVLEKSEGESELEATLKEKEEIIVSLQSEKSKLVSDMERKLEQESGKLKEQEGELSKLQSSLQEKEAIVQKLQEQLATSQENSQKLEEATLEIQTRKLEEAQNLLKEKESEFKSIKSDLQTELSSKTLENEALLTELSALTSKLQTLQDDLDQNTILQENEVKTVIKLEEELKLKDETISNLQSQLDEFEAWDGNGSNEEVETLKMKISEMEMELVDRNQHLKQQSLQLQDLRRSLAKEINKNQDLSSSGTTGTTTPNNQSSIPQQQCNGGNNTATLPPQETDVNFMYLRSVLFKYLTTSDAAVTQQLTRVVATLLHLNEEEAALLKQVADRNVIGYFGRS